MSNTDNKGNENQSTPPATVEAQPARSKKTETVRLDMIVIGLLLIGVGGLLLASSFNPDFSFEEIIWRWWPLLIVAAGLIKVLQAFLGVPAKGSGIGWLLLAGIILFFFSGAHWRWMDGNSDMDVRIFGWSTFRVIDSTTETWDAANLQKVVVLADHADVHVTGTDSDTVTARQHLRVRRWDYSELKELRDHGLETTREDGLLTIHARPETFNESYAESIRITLRLTVPEGTAVEVRGEHTDLYAERLESELSVEMAQSDVELHETAGKCAVRLEGGDFEAYRLQGTLHLTGERMEIDIEHPRAAVDVDVTRSSIELESGIELSGDIRLATTERSIEIELLDGDDFTLNATAEGGRVYVDYSGIDIVERSAYTHVFGSGRYSVSLSTVGGSISLDER